MFTIGVNFRYSSTVYTYMTDDTTIKVGDQVVVKTRDGLKIVDVAEVHSTPQLSGPHQYTWIVQKIDMTHYEEMIKRDHEGGGHA